MSDHPASNKTFEARFEVLKTEAIAIVSSMHELVKYVSSEDDSDKLHVVDEEDEDEDDNEDDEHDDDETRAKKQNAAKDREHASIYKEYSSNASVQSKLIYAIKDVYWEQPDSAPANRAHIAKVSSMLQSAWAKTGHAEKYSDAVEQCIAKFRLLDDDLILANRPPDKHESQSDQKQMILDMSYMVDHVKARVEALETYRSSLEDLLKWQKNQIDTLFENDAWKQKQIVPLQEKAAARDTTVQKLTERMDKTEVLLKLTNGTMNAMSQKVDNALIANAPATRTKTWRTLWRANMSPEMQTLPDLLAQLQRPATP